MYTDISTGWNKEQCNSTTIQCNKVKINVIFPPVITIVLHAQQKLYTLKHYETFCSQAL